uniref:Uncharacterized protein n=1 Tax=Dulem virus 33 TaxID=3145751 RepID=A0AAU8B690_9CAUD
MEGFKWSHYYSKDQRLRRLLASALILWTFWPPVDMFGN